MQRRSWLRLLAASLILSTAFSLDGFTSSVAAPPSEVHLDLTSFQGDASVVVPGTIGFLSVSGSTSFAIDVVATGNVTDVTWSAAAPASSLTLEKNLHGILSVQGTLKAVTILGNILEANTIVIDQPVQTVYIEGNTAQPIIISADVGELHITGNVNDAIAINGPATVGAIVIEGNLNEDITVGSGATVNTIFIAGNFTGGAEIIVEDGGYVGVLLVGGEFNGESPVPPQEGDPACVTNHAPVASAVSSPPSPSVGTVVTLDATGSTDPDGGDTLTFKWSVVSAPEPVVFSPDDISPVVTFTPGVAGTYSLRLTATDLCGFVDTVLMSIEATTPSLRALLVYADLPTLEIRAGIFDFASIPPAHLGSVVLPVDPETEAALPGLAVTSDGKKAIVLLGETQSKAFRLDLSGPSPVVDGGALGPLSAYPTSVSSKALTPLGTLSLVGTNLVNAGDGGVFFLGPSTDPFGEAFPPLFGPDGGESRGIAVTGDGTKAVICRSLGGISMVDLTGPMPVYEPPLVSLQEVGGDWTDVVISESVTYVLVERNPGPPDPCPDLPCPDPSVSELLTINLPTRTIVGESVQLAGDYFFMALNISRALSVLVGEVGLVGVVTVMDMSTAPPTSKATFDTAVEGFLPFRPSISWDGGRALVPQLGEKSGAPGLLLINLENLDEAPLVISQAADGTDLSYALAAEFLP